MSPRAGTHRAIRLASSPPSSAAPATVVLCGLNGASPDHHRSTSTFGAVKHQAPPRLSLPPRGALKLRLRHATCVRSVVGSA